MKRAGFAAAVVAVVVAAGCNSEKAGPITASGTIETVEVTLNAKVGGAVVKLAVDEGTRVKKGDLLAKIDTSTLEIQLRQAQANVAAAEAQYKLAKLGFRREDLAQAEANLSFAEAEFRRAEQLFAKSAVTRRQYDDAVDRVAVAREARNKLKKGFLPEEIDAALAKLNLARAQEEQVRKLISDAEVLSPADGTVTQKSIEEGDDVMVNSRLFRVSKLDPANLMIYVPEGDLAKVRIGQPANVYIDSFPNKPFKGKVVYISSVAEFTPKNVQTKDDRTKLVFGVKIEIPNPDFVLKPGMPADGELLNGPEAPARRR